jgi:hypothetical protein
MAKLQIKFAVTKVFQLGVVYLCFFPDDFIQLVVFTAAYFGWDHTTSPIFMGYLRSRWEKLPELEPENIPEMYLSNFTRAEMLRLTNNMRNPVVIRGAVANTKAAKLWNEKYFTQNFGDENVIVREMFDETKVRMQLRTFREFYSMRRKGRNVTIVASSSIFSRNEALKSDVRSPIDDDLIGPRGERIICEQFFITPGARSWYHSELGNNVFRQIAGRKRTFLISPKQNFWMCPTPVISGTSTNPCIGRLTAEEREGWIKRVPRAVVYTGPGDILVNGGWWWHDVHSLGGPDEEMISVAGRIKNLRETFRNSPMQTIFACNLDFEHL